jgi:hypothetical protein
MNKLDEILQRCGPKADKKDESCPKFNQIVNHMLEFEYNRSLYFGKIGSNGEIDITSTKLLKRLPPLCQCPICVKYNIKKNSVHSIMGKWYLIGQDQDYNPVPAGVIGRVLRFILGG